jgi:hypothetical protein
MSARPHSLNDELPSNPSIRRDQYKRIKGIVDIHRERPILIKDLVRDYCKGVDKVKSVFLFPDEVNPVELRVISEGSDIDSMSTQILQTIYIFPFAVPEIVEPPVL